MRGNILKGTHGRMNGQFYSLFHRDDAWPKLLVFVIIVFYVTIFALFALSYTYIFSGLWGSNTGRLPVRTVGSDVNVLKDVTAVPKNLATSLDTNVIESITTSTAVPSTLAPATSVRVNGNTIPVSNGGTVHKEISIGNGAASIDVSVQSNGSSSSSSSSSIDLNVSSSSNTASEVQQ
jgi:hypothetical protein